jgi:hypothetical protein
VVKAVGVGYSYKRTTKSDTERGILLSENDNKVTLSAAIPKGERQCGTAMPIGEQQKVTLQFL